MHVRNNLTMRYEYVYKIIQYYDNTNISIIFLYKMILYTYIICRYILIDDTRNVEPSLFSHKTLLPLKNLSNIIGSLYTIWYFIFIPFRVKTNIFEFFLQKWNLPVPYTCEIHSEILPLQYSETRKIYMQIASNRYRQASAPKFEKN